MSKVIRESCLRHWCLVLCMILGWTCAIAIPPRPVPAQFVADFAGLFDDSYRVMQLEQYLDSVSDSTGVQVQVVTVDDLEGEAPYMYARQIGETWGVGDENKNNGVVILIKPRNETQGEVFIATGYGSECLLTDVECDRIIEQYMLDFLLERDYLSAAESAAHVCAEVMMSGNSSLIDSGVYRSDDDEWGLSDNIGLFVLFLPFILAIGYKLSPKRRAKDKIQFANTPAKLEAALENAKKVKLSKKDTEDALHAMKSMLYTRILNAQTPSHQQELIASLAGMPLAASIIENIVAGMKEQTLREYMDCKSSSKLKGCLNRAVAFGNDEEELQKSFASRMATCLAIEEAARKAAAERRARSGGGGSHGSSRSYGGGHFGGGGAGRHF